MTAKYTHDYGAFDELVLKAEFMVAEMRSRGDKVKEAAEASAPRRTGKYAESFTVTARADGGIRGNRAEAIVENDAPDAIYVEFGNGHEGTAHHTLLRALDAAGD